MTIGSASTNRFANEIHIYCQVALIRHMSNINKYSYQKVVCFRNFVNANQ